MGTVGLNWQFSGTGNFSSRGTSDLLLRNSNTGGLQVYDIDPNEITGSAFLGTVGLDWQFSGVGNFSGMPRASDLLLRNTTTGGLEVYNIANNQIAGAAFLGTIGLLRSSAWPPRRGCFRCSPIQLTWQVTIGRSHRRLRGGAATVGVFACHHRRSHLCCIGGHHRFRGFLQA